VLLVEDDRVLRAAIERRLGAAGASVLAVGAAKPAIEVLAAQGFDLVLTDYHLGMELTGLDVLRFAAAHAPTTVRVIATGSLDDAVHRAAATGLAHRLLEKPVSGTQLDELLAVVRRIRGGPG
jgi:CheY-like chemotaxis protein